MQQIARIALENYRNLSLKEGMTLRPLNIFIGPNGSGKSNLIRFLRFIHDTLGSQGSVDGAFEKAVQTFGANRILNFQASSATVDLSILLDLFEGVRTEFNTELISIFPRVIPQRESLWLDPAGTQSERFPYYDVHSEMPGEGVVSVYTDIEKRTVQSERVYALPSKQFVFHSLQTFLEKSNLPPRDIPYHEERRRVMEFVDKWRFYNATDMPSSGIKAATPKLGMRDDTLSESGENLSLVLYNLVKEFVDFGQELQEAMTQLFPRTRWLRAIEVIGTSIQLEWYVGDNKEPFSLKEMSDGTIRMLCWAAILLSPKPASLIALDEPEMGIHPSWLGILAGWITRASRKTQVILSTHSPDLLDYFTEERESVYVFSTDPDNMTSNLVKPLKEEWLKPKLEEGWQLGDLYRVGDPAVGGWE